MAINAPSSIDSVFRMYDDIRIGANDVCRACRQAASDRFSSPISPWVVGEEFANDSLKLLFVGKTARNNPGQETGRGFHDARERGRELFFKESWPYWSYTRAITEELFGSAEAGWRRIAFTNLVKCNDSADKDTTPPDRAHRCLRELKVFQRELEILRPARVVFYTGWDYDAFLEDLDLGAEKHDVSNAAESRKVGRKQIPWWHRMFRSDGHIQAQFLRTAHPERKKREDFVKAVVAWVRGS